MTADAMEPAQEGPPAMFIDVSVSRGFSDWLRRAGCSLAFTSYQSGQLFLVGRNPNGAVSVHQQNYDRAMGLCARPNRLYVASLYRIWRLENVLGPGQAANGHFDRLYAPRNAQTIGDVDIHELAVDRSGRLIFVNTKYSCLATVSPTHGFAPVWKPPFISKLAPEDRCHLNGLAMEDGLARYVTAVARSDVVDGWRAGRNDGGVVIDVQADTVLAEGLSMPHSPRLHDGALWALDSGRGHLVRIDRQTGEKTDVTFCPGFLRGLAFQGRYALVTISPPRGGGAFVGLDIGGALKTKAAEAWCGVLVIDTASGDIIEWIRADGAVGELFDVAVIEGVCPMAIGVDSSEIRTMTTFDSDFAPLNSEQARP